MSIFSTLRSFIVVIATISFCHCCHGQSQGLPQYKDSGIVQTKSEKIDELMARYEAYGKFNGAVLVAEDGKFLFKKGYGFANMDWNIPNEPNTKFRLASVTKQFTAMLTLQLVQDKKLKLEGVVTDYLDDYPKENGDRITIHQLLTHTSGLPNYTSYSHYQKMMKESRSPSELVQLFADSTLQFVPGERFSYSNSGYALLGVIIEKVSGVSLAKIMKEKIFDPLQMHNTGFERSGMLLPNRATGYDKSGLTYTMSSYIDMSLAYAAGGLYSTVEDLLLWDQALYTTKLLSKEYMDLIFEKQIPAWGQHYGYGWLIGDMTLGTTDSRVAVIEHDGVINGFRSLVLRFPDTRSSIILLHNAGSAPLYDIAKAVGAIIYEKEYEFPKQSIAHSLAKKIESKGIKEGVQYYDSIRWNNNYHLDEREMNMLSYELLNSGKGEQALEVLKLAIGSFPNAFNLYDSYGEICNKLGRREEAIKNYTRSVELNPKNENGIKMLQQMGIDVDKESLYLLKTDSTWSKEIFVLPLHFAEGLNYQGTEEAHFPKGWRKPDNPEFWSYVFAWNIDLAAQMTADRVANDLQIYFDGLCNVVNKNKDRVLPSSVATMKLISEAAGVSNYAGHIDIFDTFVTNEPMRLYVQSEQHYCEQKGKSVVYFRFSPKSYDHEIWDTLEHIHLRTDICDE